ncbi:placenta-specific protein 9-like [Erpetoichthys calabaricus]|uniref:placenta-specific protein 9-like n=1 Tax=Erpetoichthys calabaricus TaxID=27687 RepID=UPI00109F3EF3|nr:placenta-specific protein 9-like [Erpetoichthys calabaricus]
MRGVVSFLGILLLLASQAEAGPDPGVVPRAVRENVCQKHNTLHHRLDVIEKRVEDAVGKLESEVSILLDAIEAPEWSPLLTTGGPAIDIYDNMDSA